MSDTSTKAEAQGRIATLIAEAQSKITEAEAIADQHGLTFYVDVNGTYGTGATYVGKGNKDGYYNSDEEDDPENGTSRGRWMASSQSC